MTDPARDFSGPLFFLSYARPNPVDGGKFNDSPHVPELFGMLGRELAEMDAHRAGFQYGFMDSTMAGAEDWERRVLTAAGTCQVFVALLNEKYIAGSRWCAMEWDAVSRRRVIKPDGVATNVPGAILPVLWAPTWRKMPGPITKPLWFTPEIDDPTILRRYRNEGLLGVLRASEKHYGWVVWKLAMHIRGMIEARWIEEKIWADTSELNDTFEGMGQ